MIIGDKVCVRTLKREDLAEFHSLSSCINDAGDFMPVSLLSSEHLVQAFQSNGCWHDHSGRLVIENKAGQIVGEIGLFKATHYIDGREIYYRIFSGHRSHGYASEALQLLIKVFFESTSMNRLQAVVVDGNTVSEHMLTKAGFSFEGCMRQARYFKGELVNLNLYGLTRQDWRNTKS